MNANFLKLYIKVRKKKGKYVGGTLCRTFKLKGYNIKLIISLKQKGFENIFVLQSFNGEF